MGVHRAHRAVVFAIVQLSVVLEVAVRCLGPIKN